MANESNEYILGTDEAELFRLGVQHQVWASEAQKGWESAKFTQGQTILDLGCGPGFATKELAFIVGARGKVIGVDKSEGFIEHLKQTSELHRLNIEAQCVDFNHMQLQSNSLDGMYCRWALAWLSNPKEVLIRVKEALKPGGKMVIHEYYDWSTHSTEPAKPSHAKAIAAALRSFKEQEGEIDIGRELPRIFDEIGMEVDSIRPMTKIATPDMLAWHWPKTFYHSYFPRLRDAGYLSRDEVQIAIKEFEELETIPGATLFCPMMFEVIASK